MARTLGRQALATSVLDDLLTGAGAPDGVGALVDAEWSWRLVVLSALRDALAERPDALGPDVWGPLPAADDAWALLDRALKARPGPVRALLAHPTLGTWATHLLRRLRGTVGSERALWVDAGGLHALAAAAAVVAGLDFATTVPTVEGRAVLPSLGCAQLPVGVGVEGSVEGCAEVTSAHGRVRVATSAAVVELPADPAQAAPGWRPHPRVNARAAGQELSLVLEDVDPYRGFLRPEPPAALGAAEIERWQRLTQEAFALLAADDAAAAEGLALGLSALVPVPATEPFRPQSASSGDAFGAALASAPDDATQFACTLVHEFAHNRLGALFHLFDFYRDEEGRLGYAPWRDDPRPLGGRLQGVYAFTAVTRFWLLRCRADGAGLSSAELEFTLWRAQTLCALRELAAGPGLTDMGSQLVVRLTETVEGWHAEPVAPESAALAEGLALDHRAAWRAHHLRVSSETIAALCAARARGDAPEPRLLGVAPSVVPDPTAGDLDTRAVLTRIRLTAPHRLTAPDALDTLGVSGASAEDLLLVTGDVKTARAGYRSRVEADPGAVSAWIGLGLALRALGHEGAASGLLHRPEIVLALARAEAERTGRTPDPETLAAWVGAAEIARADRDPATADPAAADVPAARTARTEASPQAHSGSGSM